MSDVFVSYSRENKVFARRLTDRLVQENKESWVDWIGIPKTAPNWWTEIKTGIENADSFVFIMSPASMASVVCNLEVDYAIELGKRIIPIVYQEIETKEAFASIADYQPDKSMQERLEGQKPIVIATDNWERLSHINWIFFRDEDDFETAFQELVLAVDTDLDYVKAHTRYLTRAKEWQRNDGRSDLLIFGEEIERAETWLIKADNYAIEQSSDKEEVVNPLAQDIQRVYIEKSRSEDTRRKRLARSAQVSIAVLAVVLIIGAIGATVIVSQTQQRVVDAQGTLTPIPQTLSFVEGQVTNAVAAQNDAEAQADAASTQVSVANEQLATATQALVTATYIAEQAQVANTVIAQAAINEDIISVLADSLILSIDNGESEIIGMNNLIEHYPQEALAYYARGLVNLRFNNYLEAASDFSRAITLEPSNLNSYSKRGLAYYYLGEYENSVQDYDRVIELSTPDFEVGVPIQISDNTRVRILRQLGTIFNNRGLAYHYLGNYELALEDYTRAIETEPQLANAFYNRGLTYREIGDYELALEDYTRAIEINPQYSNAYSGRGNIYYRLKDYDLALQNFTLAIDANPQNTNAYFNRGTVYETLGNYELAFQDYAQAIQLSPQHSSAHYGLGNVYYALSNFELALISYSQSIEINPQYIEAYYRRGLTHSALGNYDDALQDYSRVIEVNPQNTNAYFYRGTVYETLGNYELAFQDYAQAIQLSPQFSNAHYGLGNVYYALGDFELALISYNQAIEISPQYAEAYNNRGLANYNLGNYEAALHDQDRAIEIIPEYVEAYLNRGLTHYFLESYQNTLSDFETYESYGYTIPDWATEFRDEAQRIVNEEE